MTSKSKTTKLNKLPKLNAGKTTFKEALEIVKRNESYHCNYCGKELWLHKGIVVCDNPKCPSFALYQVPCELT